MTTQRTARFAGLVYLLIIILGILNVNFIESAIVVSGDNTATISNMKANDLLFRIGIVIETIMFVLVVLLSVALYTMLKEVNKNIALTALFFRFGEGILGAAVTVVSALIPLLLLESSGESGGAFEAGQLAALIGIFLKVRVAGLDIILILIGIGGALFCYLFFKSELVPRMLAAWGMFTYISMGILALVNILVPGRPDMIEIVLFSGGALFEVTFGIWLMVKGVNS